MRRIAFRRLLPIIQVLLTTVLLYKGYLTYVEATAAWKGTWFENSTEQYHIYNPALEFCLAMNGPALLVGALAGMLAAGVLGSPELGTYFGVAIGTLMAAAFWYAYGLWVDRQLGTLPNNQVSLPGRLVWALAWFALAFLATVFLWSLTWDFSPRFRPPFRIFRFFGLFWSGLLAASTALTIRRWRALARAAASSSAQS